MHEVASMVDHAFLNMVTRTLISMVTHTLINMVAHILTYGIVTIALQLNLGTYCIVLGVPSKRIFGKSWAFGPTRGGGV